MRNGDFSDDAFGNPNAAGMLTQSVYEGRAQHHFQCDSAGCPLTAAANGSQARRRDCNKIPQGLINPIGQKLINLYPLPNANNAANGYNYVSEPVRKLNEGKFDIRLDHNFSSRDSMFARFSYDQATSYVPGGSPGFAEQAPLPATRISSITGAMRRFPRRTIFAKHRE